MSIFAWIRSLKSISPNNLNQLAQDSEPVSIFDINSRQSWMKTYVPGALNFDPVDEYHWLDFR